jgi:thiamine-monophosphate kinase
MIDLSDGLSSDLLHITRSSGLGCRVHTGKIPVSDPTRKMAAEFHLDPLIAALSGGEDYELLFTVATGDLEKVQAMDDISIIGHMVKAEEGEMLIGPDGSTVKIEAQGWQHLG